MARTRAKDAADLAQVFADLQRPMIPWTLPEGHLPLLRRNAKEVVEMSRRLVEGADPNLAVRATVVLLALGEQADLTILENALLSGDRFQRVAAGSFAAALPERLNPALLDLVERVAARSEDPYVAPLCVRSAIRMRGAAIAADLAILQRLRDQGHQLSIDGALCTFLDHAAGALRREGLELFDAMLNAGPRDQFTVLFFAARADETCIPRLWKLFTEGERPFSGERDAVLAALVRLNAPGIRDVLIADLAKDEFRPALGQLRTLLAGTNDQDAIARIVERFRKERPGRSSVGFDCALTVAAIGGPEMLPLVEQLTEGLSEDLRSEARLEARGVTLAQALDELEALNILNRQQRARAKAKSRGGTTLGERIRQALKAAGVLLRFDAEFSGTPVPHDRLLIDLASLAESAFSLEDVSQEGPLDGAEEEAYVVRFTLASKPYEFRCGDQSDWFDYRAVADALNRALADTGIAQRFVGLAADGQFISFIFTTPESAEEARRRGLLTLSRPPT